jgi:hypothetical protein
MSEDVSSKKEPAAGPSASCRSQPSRAQRDRPLREDCRYRKARMLVVLAYSATAPPSSSASGVQSGSPTLLDLRRAAVAAGSTVIREHEGLVAPIAPMLGRLGEALERGEREGWLDARAADRLRRLSTELGAI